MTNDGFLKIILVVVIIPILFLEFLHFSRWIVAEPISNLESSGLAHIPIPPEAKSYQIEHSQVVFNEHGTIQEEFPIFVIWLFVYAFSFYIFYKALWYVTFEA